MNISSSTHTFTNTRYVDYEAISTKESDGQLHLHNELVEVVKIMNSSVLSQNNE